VILLTFYYKAGADVPFQSKFGRIKIDLKKMVTRKNLPFLFCFEVEKVNNFPLDPR